MNTTRRQFLDVLLAVAGSAGLLAACGGDDDGTGPTDGGGGGACNPVESIGTNHGHSINVSAADVAAGATMSYDITGTAAHSHDVNIGASQFTTLQGGTAISVESSAGGSDGHTHSVSISCA